MHDFSVLQVLFSKSLLVLSDIDDKSSHIVLSVNMNDASRIETPCHSCYA